MLMVLSITPFKKKEDTTRVRDDHSETEAEVLRKNNMNCHDKSHGKSEILDNFCQAPFKARNIIAGQMQASNAHIRHDGRSHWKDKPSKNSH